MKPRQIQTGMDRRRFLTLAGLAGAGLAGGAALAGCGSSGGGGAPGAYSVQFWDAFENSSEQDFFTTEFVTAFNSTHKDIQLDLTVKQIQTLFQAVTTALAAGSGPDIIEADGSSQA